jgi:hypothetical protein
MTEQEFLELPEDVQNLINKEAQIRCDFKMSQFFESIRNILHIRENAFCFDPYFHLNTSDLKEAYRIILERYKKECNMGLPNDEMLMKNRLRFKMKSRGFFRDRFERCFHGRVNDDLAFKLEKFMSEQVEQAFDVDQIYKQQIFDESRFK